MPCPWYRNGYCTSPRLAEPTDAIVNLQRCLSDSDYRTCAYFEELGISKESEAVVAREKSSIGIYLPIHGLVQPIKSECPLYVIERHDSGLYIASCKILNRYLTKYEVPLCKNNWQDCPYRKFAHTLVSR